MPGNIIHDLDLLRPSPEYVRLGGKDIDISFIPSGIAIDIIMLKEKLDKSKKEKESFGYAADLCAAITGIQHEEMTKEWLLKNTSMDQLYALMVHIFTSVNQSLETVEDENIKGRKAVKKNP